MEKDSKVLDISKVGYTRRMVVAVGSRGAVYVSSGGGSILGGSYRRAQ